MNWALARPGKPLKVFSGEHHHHQNRRRHHHQHHCHHHLADRDLGHEDSTFGHCRHDILWSWINMVPLSHYNADDDDDEDDVGNMAFDDDDNDDDDDDDDED